MKLKYYSMTPNDKPDWLLRLQFEVSQHYALRGIGYTRGLAGPSGLHRRFHSQFIHASGHQDKKRGDG